MFVATPQGLQGPFFGVFAMSRPRRDRRRSNNEAFFPLNGLRTKVRSPLWQTDLPCVIRAALRREASRARRGTRRTAEPAPRADAPSRRCGPRARRRSPSELEARSRAAGPARSSARARARARRSATSRPPPSSGESSARVSVQEGGIVEVPIAGRDPVPATPGGRPRAPVAPRARLEGDRRLRLLPGRVPEQVVLHRPSKGPEAPRELLDRFPVAPSPGPGKSPQNRHHAPGAAVVGPGLAPSSPWAGFPVPGGFPVRGQLTGWKGRAWTGAHGWALTVGPTRRNLGACELFLIGQQTREKARIPPRAFPTSGRSHSRPLVFCGCS